MASVNHRSLLLPTLPAGLKVGVGEAEVAAFIAEQGEGQNLNTLTVV
jgi:hypothetical protein